VHILVFFSLANPVFLLLLLKQREMVNFDLFLLTRVK